MKITWLERSDLVATAMRAMQPVEVVLDIGCGIVPQRFVKPHVHICCEPYTEYVSHLQKNILNMEGRDRSYLVLNMGWNEVVRNFPEKSVDTIFLVDVIEHLEKEEGRALLEQTEKIARRQVVIFTPLGFMPQHHADGKDAWGLSGGAWQEHKSGWMPEDFAGEEWEFFAVHEYHTTFSDGQLTEQPFGAFWAIKTYRTHEKSALMEREMVLQMRDADLQLQEAALRQKEAAINRSVLSRLERKIRRVLRGIFS